MKIQTNDGKIYIALQDKFHRFTIKFALFTGAYFSWCLFWFIANVVDIVAGHASLTNVFSGSVHVLCLFLCATWIEELLNDI